MSTKVFPNLAGHYADPPPPPEPHHWFEVLVLYVVGSLIGYALWAAKAITEAIWNVHR